MVKLLLLGLAILLLGCSVDIATEEVLTKSWAEKRIPQEAKILEHLSAVQSSSRQMQKNYIIYKFRGQCILAFYGNRRYAMTTINCPKESAQ